MQQLSQHPAVEAAAVAAARGFGDFHDLLARSPADFDLMVAGLRALTRVEQAQHDGKRG